MATKGGREKIKLESTAGAGSVEVTSASCGFQLDFLASAFGCHGV